MARNPTETARKLMDEALTRLTAESKAERNSALADYLTVMSRFPDESWRNALLVWSQRPSATHVAGHHGWNDLGRQVKEGERGILILTPERPDRTTYAFDVSQTEGRELLAVASPTADPRRDGTRIETLLAEQTLKASPGVAVENAVRYVVTRTAPQNLHRLSIDKDTLAQQLALIQENAGRILRDLSRSARPDRTRDSVSTLQEPLLLDWDSFATVHREYGNRLVDSVTGFVRDRDKAEEIAARAFLKAWENRDRFQGKAAPSTWIEAIARHETWAFYGKENASRFESLDRPNPRDIAAPGLVTDALEKQDDLQRLHRALEKVPEKQRTALVAHFVEGLAIREIARKEAVPLGTVLSRIHSGKQMLREAWNENAQTRSQSQGVNCRERPDWSKIQGPQPPEQGRSR